MTTSQQELFTKPLRPPMPRTKRAHVSDAGDGMPGYPFGARFECGRCGWESEWLCFETVSEIKRGIACANCAQA